MEKCQLKNKLAKFIVKISKSLLKYLISAIICVIIFIFWGLITDNLWDNWQYKAFLNILDYLLWIILPPIVSLFFFSFKKPTIHTFIFSITFITILSLLNILFINSIIFNLLLVFIFTGIVVSIQLLIIKIFKLFDFQKTFILIKDLDKTIINSMIISW